MPLAVVVGAIVPHVGEQGVPACVRVQVTPLLVTSFATVAINCCMALTATLAVGGATETVIPTTVAVAEFDLDVSDTEVAVIVTIGLAGRVAGAVYVAGAPLGVAAGAIVPQPGEHGAPACARVQVTPRLPASLLTVAVKFCVPPTGTLALPGETATAMAGTVIVAEPDLVVSAAEVAVMVTVRLLAGGPGAV